MQEIAETSSNTSDELGVLRQLLHREQAFFDIEMQQAKLFEKDSFDSIKNLIFLTRKVFSLHLSVLQQQKTGQPISVPDLSTLSHVLPAGFSATQQRAYQNAISTILTDFSKLGKMVSQYILQNPEKENYVVFSLMPALFSSLWSQEESNRFVDFLLSLDKRSLQSFTRVLLVHQSFFVFLSSIQAEATAIVGDDPKLTELLDLIKSRSFLFPSTLRSLMSRTEDPVEFFTDCVLKPLLQYPSLYGLLPSSETRTFSALVQSLESSKTEITVLVQFLKDTTNSIQVLPTETSLESVLANNEQLIYLFVEDCSVISGIFEEEIVPPTVEGVYQIPYKRHTYNATKRSDSIDGSEDPFESLLRSLVIQLDVSRAGPNIIETLESALILHAGASRLQYELRLDEFKQMKKQRGAPDDVSYYVNLLTKAYEQRMKHRKATLSNSTTSDVFKVQHLQCTQAVQFLLQTRQMALFNMWNEEKPFDSVDDKMELLCTDSKAFAACYKELIQKFVAFAESKKLPVMKDQMVPIIFNRLTQKVTLDEFIKFHPDLAAKDEAVADLIANHKDYLYANNNHSFLKVFKDDPSLLGLAASHLRRAFEENSAIPIAEWIDRSLSALIHVLSFQGMKEIGADHWLPMTLILFIHVNPPHLCSAAMYMYHVMLTLPESNPVSQSVEYNVTMTHSASSYFMREVDNPKLHESN